MSPLPVLIDKGDIESFGNCQLILGWDNEQKNALSYLLRDYLLFGLYSLTY